MDKFKVEVGDQEKLENNCNTALDKRIQTPEDDNEEKREVNKLVYQTKNLSSYSYYNSESTQVNDKTLEFKLDNNFACLPLGESPFNVEKLHSTKSTDKVEQVIENARCTMQHDHPCNLITSTRQPVMLIIKSKSIIDENNNIVKEKVKEKRLRKYTSSDDEDNELCEKNVDSGYAWVILAVMFLINSSTFGTARAYGLIFEKLAREDEQSRTEAALPFTVMGAIENMGGPLTGYLLTRTHSWRITVMLGSCLISLAHLLTAFCLDSQTAQVLIMGFMCGLGLSLVSISFFQINNAYFVRYRSRAFGLGLTGAVFGTFYISPLCQYVLIKYNTKYCYLLLSLILFPNVPLSLLLRPKKISSKIIRKDEEDICSISRQVDQELLPEKSITRSTILVIKNPAFHLIWPTQILFCWFNFVFGMVIVDFGLDRGLDSSQVSQLIPVWAFGQLVGRVILGSFVDMKFLSHRYFTVVCFTVISLATYILNNVQIENYENILVSSLVFILSVFISNLYILFNGLIITYMEKSLTALSIGISSFIGSFFLLPRAYIIGYYRDTFGNYDSMLTLFTYVSLVAALTWFLVPDFCLKIYSFITVLKTSTQTVVASKC